MTMVVTFPCIGCKDKSCLPVCPVECFHEDESMVYINPLECTECNACVVECPTEAIFHEDDVPDRWHTYTKLNAERSSVSPSAHP